MVGRRVEELGAVNLALVNLEDVAVRGDLLLVELLELRALFRGSVLFKSLLTWLCPRAIDGRDRE